MLLISVITSSAFTHHFLCLHLLGLGLLLGFLDKQFEPVLLLLESCLFSSFNLFFFLKELDLGFVLLLFKEGSLLRVLGLLLPLLLGGCLSCQLLFSVDAVQLGVLLVHDG